VHLSSSLRYGLGEPLLAAGIIGFVLAVIRQPRQGVLVALFPAVYYAMLGAGYTVFARYILPVTPFFCLAAALAVVETAGAAAAMIRRPAWRPALVWTIAACVIAPSAWSVVRFDLLLGRTDSRLLAADWIRTRFRNGATIGEVGRLSTRRYFPREEDGRPSRYISEEIRDEGQRPDALVVPTSLFDPTPEFPPAAMTLAQQYVPMHVVPAFDPSAAAGVVYDWQDEFYLPLRGFHAILRRGPTLTMYVRPDLPELRP
jgi:hypothetical protein